MEWHWKRQPSHKATLEWSKAYNELCEENSNLRIELMRTQQSLQHAMNYATIVQRMDDLLKKWEAK